MCVIGADGYGSVMGYYFSLDKMYFARPGFFYSHTRGQAWQIVWDAEIQEYGGDTKGGRAATDHKQK